MTSPYNPTAGQTAGQTAGSTNGTTGYSFNPNDPYNLQNLAHYGIFLGTETVPAHITRQHQQDVGSLPANLQLITGQTDPGYHRSDQGENGGGGDLLVTTPASKRIQTQDATKYIGTFLSLYGTNRKEFNALRTALAEAGFYGDTPLNRVLGRAAGSWDVGAIRSAIVSYRDHTQALTASGATPNAITFNEYLLGVGGQNNSADGTSPSAPVTQLTDPATLTVKVQGAARASLGHELTDKQLGAFISAFHANESAYQLAGPGSTAVQPDPGADAAQFIQQQYGTEQGQHETQGYLNALLNTFLPSSASRANLNTDPYATA